MRSCSATASPATSPTTPSGYLSDTFAKDRLTVNLGLRYDHQTSGNLPTSATGHPLIPNSLPSLDFDGGGTGASWDNISPRIGFTYALNESRKTVLRANYAMHEPDLDG